jgi:iron complex transport system permease protein
MMQGLFRNPLADPGLVGVTSGAATAAVAAIVLGSALPASAASLLGSHLLPVAAFGGGLLNTALLYALATRGGRTSTATLILAGIAVAALAGALTGLMIFRADDAALRDVTFWSLGSLGGATGAKVAAVAPFVLAALAVIPFVARGLDALLLGEAEAFHLGVSVETLKRVVIVAVAAASGATVAATGSIGFVGIVVPHLLRLVMGPVHRHLLPASAFGGAALLLAADALCRVVVAPAELPIGIVTALIGAPVFLAILLRRADAAGSA